MDISRKIINVVAALIGDDKRVFATARGYKKMYEWFVGHIDGSVIDYMEDYLYDYLLEHFKEPELLQKKMDFYNAKIEEGEAKKDDSYRDFQAERCGLYVLRTMADMKRPIEEIRQYSKGVKMYNLKETMAQIERDYGNMDELLTKEEYSKASGLVSLAGSHTLFITNTASIAEHNYIKKRYE